MELFSELFLISWHGAFKWLVLGVFCIAILRIKSQIITFLLKNIIVSVFIPLLIFYKTLLHLDTSRMIILPQYCLWAFAFLLIAELLSRGISKFGVLPENLSTFHLGNTFNNYGFVAYGLVESLYGPALLTELFAYVIFSEIYLWTRGRAFFSEGKFDYNILLKNPPLIAFSLALILKVGHWTPIGLSATLDTGLHFVTSWTVPLAIFCLGGLIYHQKSHFKPRNFWKKENSYSLLLRHLILPPLLCSIVVLFTQGNLKNALLIEAVMPSSLMTITLAKIYGGKPEIMSLMAFCSQVLSLVTIPIWLTLFIEL